VSTGRGCHAIHVTSPPRSETPPLFLAGCAGHLPQTRSEPRGYHRNNPSGTPTLQNQPDRRAQGGAATWQPASKRNAPAVPGGLCRLSAANSLRTAMLSQEQPTSYAPSAGTTRQVSTGRGCRAIHVTSPPRSRTPPLFLEGCAGHLPQTRSEPRGYHRNNPTMDAPSAGTT
jgi:hypothetical protein